MAGMPQLDEDKLKIIQELELETLHDLFSKMTSSCHRKCIPPKYTEPDLGKGESVCLDRCVAKYLEIHDRIGKKLTQISMPEDITKAKTTVEQPQT